MSCGYVTQTSFVLLWIGERMPTVWGAWEWLLGEWMTLSFLWNLIGHNGRNYLWFHQVWLDSLFGCLLWVRWQDLRLLVKDSCVPSCSLVLMKMRECWRKPFLLHQVTHCAPPAYPPPKKKKKPHKLSISFQEVRQWENKISTSSRKK